MYTCRVCKIDKEHEDFPWLNKGGHRRATRCKDCQKVLSKKHYIKNKPDYKERDKIRRENYYNEILPIIYNFLLEHPCLCGEKEPLFLEFDHLENKHFGIASMVSGRSSWSAIQREIEKCQILCIKCHRLKTAKDGNWYKYKRYLENNSK